MKCVVHQYMNTVYTSARALPPQDHPRVLCTGVQSGVGSEIGGAPVQEYGLRKHSCYGLFAQDSASILIDSCQVLRLGVEIEFGFRV